jgi:hypothetical protein
MKERMAELLREAAKCFAEASNPFNTEWLSEHSVTADECFDLSQMIANAVSLYVYLPKDTRVSWMIKQVISESGMPDEQKRYMLASIDFKDAMKKISGKAK